MNKGRSQAVKSSRKAAVMAGRMSARGTSQNLSVATGPKLSTEDLQLRLALQRSACKGSARPKRRRDDRKGGGNRRRDF